VKTIFTYISMKSKIKSEVVKPELTDSQGRVYWIEEIPIDRLDYWNSPTQIPNRYDGTAADEYAALMKDGKWDWNLTESYPVIFQEITELEEEGRSLGQRIDLWIGDGHHTLEGGDKAELETMPCKIYLGTRLDAKLYSFREANRYHGVRLSNAQKREIVIETLKDRSLLTRICEGVKSAKPEDVPSERLIAAYLGDVTSAPSVGKIWDDLILSGKTDDFPWLKVEKRLGQDGKRQVRKLPTSNFPASRPPSEEEPIVPVAPEEPIALEQVEIVEPDESIAPVERVDAIENQDDEPIVGKATSEEDDDEDELLPGFEGIACADIKALAWKHTDRVMDNILDHFDIPEEDNPVLFEKILKSIVKTLTDYRDEVRSAL
jgi:hypothetical protein